MSLVVEMRGLVIGVNRVLGSSLVGRPDGVEGNGKSGAGPSWLLAGVAMGFVVAGRTRGYQVEVWKMEV